MARLCPCWFMAARGGQAVEKKWEACAELNIGEQLITEKRKITSEDIDKFADLSGDHFYAHIKTTDFSDTMFEQQVAHGYFIMSAAAGLFVDSYEKNPVLLNYGIAVSYTHLTLPTSD